jgi:hypothetical protein
MNRNALVGFVLTFSLGLAGCSGDKGSQGGASSSAGSPSVVASCDQRGVPMAQPSCLEYTGKTWRKHEVQARCGLEGQSFIDGACPTDGVVFSCRQLAGQGMEAIQRFYGDAAKATQLCTQAGGEGM